MWQGGNNPFGFQNQGNPWGQGMPPPWGFQQQPQPPIPTIQGFLPGQGMMGAVRPGFFHAANQAVSNMPIPAANFLPRPNLLPPPPAPVPPPPSRNNEQQPKSLMMNLVGPPPPPPKQQTPPPCGSGSFNKEGLGAEYRRPDQRRPGDWNCNRCQNHNFAWRTLCAKCNLASPHSQSSQESKRGWVCPRCRISNVHPSHCAQCSLMKPILSNAEASHNSAQKSGSNIPTQEELQFDRMFAAWEEGFETWKRENLNNPDQNYVREHINKMNAMRETMLQRRENLRRQQQQGNNRNNQGNLQFDVVRDENSCISPSFLNHQGEGEPANKMARLNTFSGGARVENDGEPLGASTSTLKGPRKASRWGQQGEIDQSPEVITGRGGQLEEGTNNSNIQNTNKNRRPGDWDCMRCNKIQFAFRYECKFCKLSKIESEKWRREGKPSGEGIEAGAKDQNNESNFFRTRNDLGSFSGGGLSCENPNDKPYSQKDRFSFPSKDGVNEDEGFEENLFQRRNRAQGSSHHSASFENYFDQNPGSRQKDFDYSSAKVVDYGHGSNQAETFRGDKLQVTVRNSKDAKDWSSWDASNHQKPHSERVVQLGPPNSDLNPPSLASRSGLSERFDKDCDRSQRHEIESKHRNERRMGNRKDVFWTKDSDAKYRDTSPGTFNKDRCDKGKRTDDSQQISHGSVPSHSISKPAPEPQGDKVSIDDLIQPPGRHVRPPKLVIIFRGLPGAGKTFIAKHVKGQESEMGSEAPRILTLDDYFECDGKYEYDAELENSYRSSLVKSFKKQIDDGYFSFILVDCINDKTEHYRPMWSYAKQKGFEVYIGMVDCDPAICATRNTHGRSEKEIQSLYHSWEQTPAHFNKVDFSSFLQDKAIEHVEMKDADELPLNDSNSAAKSQEDVAGPKGTGGDSKANDKVDSTNEDEDNFQSSEDTSKMGDVPFALPSSSKWEVADRQDKMAKLDGVSQKAIRRLADAHHSSINEWLEIASDDSKDSKDTGKKRVRWADVEERQKQVKMRDIGFVVGQTNWKRMMDPTEGTQQALERTKIIPNRYQT